MADFTRIGLLWTPFWPVAGGFITFNNFTIDQAADKLDFLFQQPEAATITHLGFRYGVRTGTPVQHKISLQGVDANGNPDGTILGGGTPASGTFTPPADATWDGTWRWIALDNSIATTRGQFLSIVIEPVGTPDAGNNSAFTAFTATGFRGGNPYVIQDNNGTRTRQQSATPVYGLKSSTKAYGLPASAATVTLYSNNSTPDERGVRFLFPSTWGSTYKIVGVRFFCTPGASGKSILVSLYDGTTTLQDVTLDTDFDVQAGGSGRIKEAYFDETTLSTLNFGTAYRVAFAPTAGSVSFGLQTITVDANADLSAYPGGIECYESTRTDAGAWTDNNTVRPFVELIIDDWTVSGGTSGIIIHPGMTGGMRG